MSLKRGLIVGGICILIAVVLILIGIIRQRPDDITSDSVQAAIKKWDDNQPQSYTIRIHVKGPMTGIYELNVKDKQPVSGSFNDQKFTSQRTLAIWTGRGMLRMLEMDLKNQAKAEERGTQLMLRADFDEQYGYPSKYQRLDFETRKSVTWQVTEFIAN